MRLLIIFILSPFFLFSQTQIGNDIDGLAAGDHSGIVSFSSDGTVVAIGGPGNDDAGVDAGDVRIFENSSGDWVQIGQTIYGEAAGDQFGSSVSLSVDGSIVAIGAPYNDYGGDNAGQGQVYKNISGTWTQVGSSFFGSTGLNLGSDVGLSSDGFILALGTVTGLTSAYENNGGNWTQIGGDIQITTNYPVKYMKLSGDGTTIALGGNDSYDFWWGLYIKIITYKNIAGVWTQFGGDLHLYSGAYANDDLGDFFSLSNNGEILAFINVFRVTVYQNITNTWTLINDITFFENSYDSSGHVDLSDDGSVLAISRHGNTSSGNHGYVSVYKNESGTWIKKGNDIIGEGLGDWIHNVKLSSNGDKIAIGSATNDGNGIDSGHVRVYDLSVILSVEEYNMLSVNLFPNPTTNQFTIKLPESQTLKKVDIYNHLGQFIQISNTNIIKTAHLASGLYYIVITTTTGKVTKKLILE